jgi:N-acetylglucosaminyl-diphospho-decaprenol L-rhamnosyltransferase
MGKGAGMTNTVVPRFCFITVGYKSDANLARCFEAIAAQTLTDHTTLLWDNEPQRPEATRLRAQYPWVDYRGEGLNLGFAVGNNRAAALSQSEWLVFINPDAFAAPDFLQKIAAAIDIFPEIAMFGAIQTDALNPEQLDGAGDGYTFFGFPYRMGYGHAASQIPGKPIEIIAPSGAAMIIRRELFQRLGGFEESFFCYCEDMDLSLRAQLSGERSVLINDAHAAHIGSASLGVRSDFALYHGYRNRLWMFLRCAPPLMLWAGIVPHILLTLILALKDVAGGRRAVVARALRDGVTGLPRALAQRKIIQSRRQIGSLRLAKVLAWNPIVFFTRAIVFKDYLHDPHTRT